MNKVVCMGESLIDFMPQGKELAFVAKAGGAPSNVCACVAKLGGNGYYLGKMGKDIFSKFLISNMQKYGVNTSYVDFDERYQTALAFVALDENGDREFNFYRKETSDIMFDKSNVNEQMFENGDILHFCSLGLVNAPTKEAHRFAIECAKTKGCIISFDVNMRLGLWDSTESCVLAINEFLPYADILKVTDEELKLITNMQDEKTAVEQLLVKADNCKIVLVTKGANGVTAYDRGMSSVSHSAIDVKVVDTTGAGVCFIGCTLYLLASQAISLNIDDIEQAIDFASYGSAVVIGNYGAMEAMPTINDIEVLRNSISSK